MTYSAVSRPLKDHQVGASVSTSVPSEPGGRDFGGRGRLVTRKPGRQVETYLQIRDPQDTEGGVAAWAGATPVLGGRSRPKPTRLAAAMAGFASGVAPAHAFANHPDEGAPR